MKVLSERDVVVGCIGFTVSMATCDFGLAGLETAANIWLTFLEF